MADSKIIMFPDQGGGSDNAMWATLANNRSMDCMAPLLNNNNNAMWNNPVWALVFLSVFAGNNGLFGNRGGVQNAEIQNQLSALRDQINTNQNSTLLMDSIRGVDGSVEKFASSINCDLNSVRDSINLIQQAICNVGGKVDMSAMQVINAINSGNASLASQLSSCCCNIRQEIANFRGDMQLQICQQTNSLQNSINNVAVGQERGFSSLAYETKDQTCQIKDSIRAAAETILEGQRNAEIREMQNTIDQLREAGAKKDVIINNGQQTAVFGQMIQSATAPIVNAVSALQGDINSIKCKLPETVTLPYSCATAVPTNSLLGFGFGFNTFNNGFWG